MGSVNLKFIKGLEQYKEKIIGFTKNGFAVYPNNTGFNAIDHCECCGNIIHSQCSDADFCPICAINLGIVKSEIAKEICIKKWESLINKLDTDEGYRNYYRHLTIGFRAGINYGVKNAYVSIKGILGFDT